LLPVYNAAPYVDACLASLCSFGDPELEICVVDDGSTDDSRRRLEEWRERDRRIRLWVQPNRGVAGARNALIDMARGEILVLQDADDLSHKDRLERIAASFEERGWDLFHSRCFLFDARGRIRTATYLLRPLAYFLRAGHCPIIHGSVAVRRGALARVGRYRDIPAEDLDLWLRFLDAGLRLHYCPEPLYARRVHADSVTSRRTRLLHESSQSLRTHKSPLGVPRDIAAYYSRKIAVTFDDMPLDEVLRERPAWAWRIHLTRGLGRLMARRYRGHAEGFAPLTWAV
jgi:glycosyltransferase involved in cell wall biosynthesis